MRACQVLTAASVALALAAGGLSAQGAPSVRVEQIACMKTGANQVVHATATGEPSGGTARLYFRWMDHNPDEFYWVSYENGGPGRYWTVAPKPETKNKRVEYYGELLDAAGNVVARSEKLTAKVTGDCQVQLNARELGAAANLTIGETSTKQAHGHVDGFMCDGVIIRIDPQNVKRVDEVCRACVVAWWQRPEVLVPIVAGTTAGTVAIINNFPEASPSRP